MGVCDVDAAMQNIRVDLARAHVQALSSGSPQNPLILNASTISLFHRQIPALFSTLTSRMGNILVQKTRTSLLSVVEIQEMIVSEQPCVMEPSRSQTLNFYLNPQRLVVVITPGHNGPGMLLKFISRTYVNENCRIFRTDYGHTEVAAHFGNGIYEQLIHS